MFKKTIILVAAFVMLLSTTVFAASSGNVDWNEQYIEATGWGAPSPVARNAAQSKYLARRAAMLDAYRQLAETVQGVNINSETTVEMMMVTNDVIHSKVSATIQGAKVVSEKATPDGGYEITMRVPLFGVNSVAKAVIPEETKKEAFPAPTTSVSVNVKVNTGSSSAADPTANAVNSIQKEGIYTGVIVDCRGLGLNPAMSPVIKNADGASIYGYKNLDYDKVVSKGMAGYAHDQSAAYRAGNRPLVIKAINVDGYTKANPVISNHDADKVLVENQATHFLDNTNVVFLY